MTGMIFMTLACIGSAGVGLRLVCRYMVAAISRGRIK